MKIENIRTIVEQSGYSFKKIDDLQYEVGYLSIYKNENCDMWSLSYFDEDGDETVIGLNVDFDGMVWLAIETLHKESLKNLIQYYGEQEMSEYLMDDQNIL